jgi:hypothetical protein
MDLTMTRIFGITVLGRTLEHLGTQMYKRRDVALAELVANAWDAGAKEVRVSIPLPNEYEPAKSEIAVTDDGLGMSADQVDNDYLVIGRNRRSSGQPAPEQRKIMGRKGVGKLAGFGLGRRMNVETWQEGTLTSFELDGQALKADEGTSKELEVMGTLGPVGGDLPFAHGTRISMRALKHKTPPDIDGLHQSLARRFSRTVVGEMSIYINDEPLRSLSTVLTSREPESGETIAQVDETDDNTLVEYWAGFSKNVLPSELQGFTILVNGKTAQAPPYFFGVEGTASGQHGTKYLTGVITADYLDDGDDDESDRISTDRQEIDWEDDATQALKKWGDALTRRLLRDRLKAREDQAERNVMDDVELKRRLDFLDAPSQAKARGFIRSLGKTEAEPERILALSDTIVQAFEYRQFHDYISELDAASEDPEELAKAISYIQGWRALESRALLEVIKGRLEIIEKFFTMIVNDSPETAPLVGADNIHDLIGRYPWLLNPDWQVFSEETSMSKQLREWGAADIEPRDDTRYDFLALTGSGATIVVEIKRGAHDANLEDLQRFERYISKLSLGRPDITGVFITGQSYALPAKLLSGWQERGEIELLLWSDVHRRAYRHYEHYKAILEGDVNDDHFSRKVREVQMTRSIVASGSSYRAPIERREGLGTSD